MTNEATQVVEPKAKKTVRLRKPKIEPDADIPPPLWRLPHFDSDLLSNRLQYPSHFSHLPHPNDWRFTPFYESRRADFLDQARYFFKDRNAIKTFVDNLGLEDIVAQNGGQKVTVIEAFAGPGTLTSELISRKEVGKVIAMERSQRFCWGLQNLASDRSLKDSEGKGPQHKLYVYDRDEGFHWWAFQELEQLGAFSDLKTLAEEPNRPAHRLAPLLFVSQLPNTVHGDQLYAQLISAMGNGGWLFPYGRVKLAFILPEVLAKRAMATAGSPDRARIGAMAGIYAWQRICQSSEDLQPQTERFWPENLRALRRALRTNSPISNENMAKGDTQLAMCSVTVVPKVRQVQAWRRLSGLHEKVSPDVIDEERKVLEQEGETMARRIVAAREEQVQRDEDSILNVRRRNAETSAQRNRDRNELFLNRIAEVKAQYKEATGQELDDETWSRDLSQMRKKQGFAKMARTIRRRKEAKALNAGQDALVEEAVEEEEDEARLEKQEEDDGEIEGPPGYKELEDLYQVYKLYNAWKARVATRAKNPPNYDDEDAARHQQQQDEIKKLSQPAPEIEALAGIEVDSLDYLLRGVFVLRTKSISNALARTFPGGESVLKRIAPDAEEFYERQRKEQEAMPHSLAAGGAAGGGKPLTHPPLPPKSLRIHPDTPVSELTDEQWILLARTFERWPFRPAHLFEESKVAAVPARKPPSEGDNHHRPARWAREVGKVEESDE